MYIYITYIYLYTTCIFKYILYVYHTLTDKFYLREYL